MESSYKITSDEFLTMLFYQGATLPEAEYMSDIASAPRFLSGKNAYKAINMLLLKGSQMRKRSCFLKKMKGRSSIVE